MIEINRYEKEGSYGPYCHYDIKTDLKYNTAGPSDRRYYNVVNIAIRSLLIVTLKPLGKDTTKFDVTLKGSGITEHKRKTIEREIHKWSKGAKLVYKSFKIKFEEDPLKNCDLKGYKIVFKSYSVGLRGD